MKTNYRIVTNGKVFRVERKNIAGKWKPVKITRSARNETWEEEMEFLSVEMARAWIKSQEPEKWEVVR